MMKTNQLCAMCVAKVRAAFPRYDLVEIGPEPGCATCDHCRKKRTVREYEYVEKERGK